MRHSRSEKRASFRMRSFTWTAHTGLGSIPTTTSAVFTRRSDIVPMPLPTSSTRRPTNGLNSPNRWVAYRWAPCIVSRSSAA